MKIYCEPAKKNAFWWNCWLFHFCHNKFFVVVIYAFFCQILILFTPMSILNFNVLCYENNHYPKLLFIKKHFLLSIQNPKKDYYSWTNQIDYDCPTKKFPHQLSFLISLENILYLKYCFSHLFSDPMQYTFFMDILYILTDVTV